MSARNSVEDIESGANGQNDAEYNKDAELERIKDNYRTTVIVPELPGAGSLYLSQFLVTETTVLANFPETQVAFQELQNELQEFLGQYIPKVTYLQATLSSNLTNGFAHENRSALFAQGMPTVLNFFFFSHKSPPVLAR